VITDLSSYATNTSLALKVDVAGKDYQQRTTTKLAPLSLSSTGGVDLSNYATNTALKVDKVAGKGLSTEIIDR
jgi:hypothetical protein